MKTIEIKVYRFDELSETAKENAIKLWYESEYYEYLCDDILCFISDNDTYFSNVKLQYSLGYSQGDGLSFSGKFDIKKWINDNYNFKQSVKNALSLLFESVESLGNTGRYCYASKRDIQVDFLDHTGKTNLTNLTKLFEKVESDVIDYYLDICDKAEKYGYSIIEYRMDYAEMNELCKANDYHFYENGKMY